MKLFSLNCASASFAYDHSLPISLICLPPLQSRKTKQNKTKQNKQTNKQKNIVIVVYCIMGFLDAGWHLFLNFCTLFKALVNFHWMRYWHVYIFMISYFNRKMGIQFCRLYVMVYGFSILLCFYSFVFKKDK